MRLELRPEGGQAPGRSQPWTLEHGRRTLGRAGDCDWVVGDGDPRVSKLHCTITRTAQGYTLTDQSANGTLVDGRLLLEGDGAPLSQGSVIDIRGHRFKVSVIGSPVESYEDPTPALRQSDEALTISAILSDIAPNGQSARSLLGERRTDEPWITPKAAGGRGQKPISRDVDIGWSSPPELKPGAPVLPDNWFEDEDYGSQLEHRAAHRTFVSVGQARRDNHSDDDGGSREAFAIDDSFYAARPEPDDVVEADFDEIFSSEPRPKPQSPPAMTEPSRLSDRLAPLVTRLETSLAEAYGALDLSQEVRGRVAGTGDDALIERLERLLDGQDNLVTALDNLAREASRMLDPRLIEARVDGADQIRLPFLRGRDYWAAYRKQFEAEGRILSIRDLLRRAASGEEPAPDLQSTDQIDRADARETDAEAEGSQGPKKPKGDDTDHET